MPIGGGEALASVKSVCIKLGLADCVVVVRLRQVPEKCSRRIVVEALTLRLYSSSTGYGTYLTRAKGISLSSSTELRFLWTA